MSSRRSVGLGRRALNLLCALALATTMVQWPLTPAFAANFTYAGGADFGPTTVLNDHSTIYKVHVTAASGLTPGKTYYAIARLTDGVGSGFNNNARGYNWSPSQSKWAQVRGAATQFPAVVADASGAASATVYYKVGDESFTGFAAANGHADGQAYLSVSFSDGSNNGNPTTAPIVTVMSAKTAGAWIHNGVATGAAANVTAAADQDTNLTEADSIDEDSNGVVDDEDYGPVGATGDFRLGVAAGSVVSVSLDGSPWAVGQNVTAGPADTDIAVGASDMVPPSAPSALTAKAYNGSAVLSWTASTDAGGSGIAGYRVYRTVGLQDAGAGAGAVNSSALPVLIATVGAGATTYTDATPANGTLYQYYVRAIDAATNVSARSNTLLVTPLADTTAPVTTASGVADGGTYGDPVNFTLAADDGASGSGVATTYYTVDSDPATRTYAGPAAVSGVGSHTVSYWSVDKAGNVEAAHSVSFSVSSLLPITTISGVPSGWSTSPVTFSLGATGMNPPLSTLYALGSGEPTSYTGPVTVSTEGTTAVSYLSRSSVGDVEVTKTAQILVDTSNPYWAPNGVYSMTGYDNHLTTQILVTLDWSGAVDDISGVSQFRVWMTNGTTKQSMVVATVPAGTYTRGGNDYQGETSVVLPTVWTGTSYYFKVQAGDNAGNWSTTYNLLGGSKDNTDTVTQGFAAFDGSSLGPALPPKWDDDSFLRATNMGTESTPSVLFHWSTPQTFAAAPDIWFYSVKADYFTPPAMWIDSCGPGQLDAFHNGDANTYLWDRAIPYLNDTYMDAHDGHRFDARPKADTQYYFNIHAYAYKPSTDPNVRTSDNIGSDGPIVPVNTSWSNSPLPGTSSLAMNVPFPANTLKWVESRSLLNHITYGNIVGSSVDPSNAYFVVASSGDATYPVIAAGSGLPTACVELTEKSTGRTIALPNDADGLAAYGAGGWPVASSGSWSAAKGTFYGYRLAAADAKGDTARLEIHLPKLAEGTTYVLTLKPALTDAFAGATYSYEFTTKSSSRISLAKGSRTLATYGGPESVSGTLTADGAGVSGRKVVLQSSKDGRTYADSSVTAITGAGGAFTLKARPTSKTFYRVVFAGDSGLLAATGAAFSLTPPAKIGTPVAPSIMYRSGWRTIWGHVWPATGSASAVRIYRWRYVSGHWKQYGGYVVASMTGHGTYSTYSASMRLPYAGKWRVRAYVPATKANTGAWSAYEYVTAK